MFPTKDRNAEILTEGVNDHFLLDIEDITRVMFFLLYGETISTKAKGGNRDVIERYDTHKGENTPLGSRMKWRMESTSGLAPSKTLSSI